MVIILLEIVDFSIVGVSNVGRYFGWLLFMLIIFIVIVVWVLSGFVELLLVVVIVRVIWELVLWFKLEINLMILVWLLIMKFLYVFFVFMV